jgi:hypothetical protein
MEAGVRLTRRVARRLEPPFFSALCRHFFAPPPAFETRAIDALERAFSSLERRALLFYPPSIYLSLSLFRASEREKHVRRDQTRERDAHETRRARRGPIARAFFRSTGASGRALCAQQRPLTRARVSLYLALRRERERERERDARETRSNSLSRESFGPPQNARVRVIAHRHLCLAAP